MESVLKDELLQHLNNGGYLVDHQHGFRKGRSVTTNLLVYLEKVTNMIDQGIPVDVVYFDFAKAFDKVPHTKLIEKLENVQVGGKIKEWIKMWLSDRTQRVVLNGSFSSWVAVLSGVPQGSVLGPILFLIFINDLGEPVLSLLLCFADDTKLIRPVINTEEAEILQRDIDKLKKWTEENGMEFNAKKCAVLHFGSKNLKNQYCLGDTLLATSEVERDLGLLVQDNLKFDQNIRKIAQKCQHLISQVNRSFSEKDLGLMMKLYNTYIIPHLDFGSSVWNPQKKKDIEVLERVQRRFTRIIPDLKGLSYEERLTVLELPTLEERRNFNDLVQCYRLWNGIDFSPNPIFELVSRPAVTRSSAKNNFKTEKPRLDTRKDFFSQRTAREWNKLPSVIQNASSLNSFKSSLKSHLL